MSNRLYDILKFIAQDAYRAGDKVHYPGENDPVYVSTVDNNVWAPGVYGWEVAE